LKGVIKYTKLNSLCRIATKSSKINCRRWKL